MADKVVSLEFNVKTAGAVTEINKVTEATKGATTASNVYEKQLNDIKKQTDGGGFKELTRALKEYQNLALQAGENSPIGRQALSEAGELKDRLMDLKSAIKTTGQDGRALQASLQLGGGIVAGFGAVQGVMALVGSESEDLQKTLVKLQAVQATLASVEEIRSVLEKESALRITAVTLAEKGRAAATAISTFVTNGASMALKVFKGALIATGIGAFIVVLGSVIAYWDELTQAIGLSVKSTADYTDSLDKLSAKEQGRLNDKIERSKKELKLAELKGESDKQLFERELKINALELKAREEQSKSDQALIASYRKRNLAGEEFTDDQKQRWDKLTENERNYYEDIRKIEFDERVIKETFYQSERKKEEELKKAAEEKRKEEERIRKEKAEALKKEAEEKFKLDGERTQQEYENAATALYLFKKLDDQEKAAREESDRLKKEQEEKELQRQKELQTAKVNLALQGFDLINQLVNDFDNNSKASQEKAFKLNKTFQLAQATIEGYRGVLKAYAEAPVGLKIASAALAAGVAAAQIAKISQTKFNSAQFDKKTDTTTSNLSNTLPTNTTAPTVPGSQSTILRNEPTMIKAIVVESDITNTQKRINSIQETAKI